MPGINNTIEVAAAQQDICWEELAPEIWRRILDSHSLNLRDLDAISTTSRTLQYHVSTQAGWKRMFYTHFPAEYDVLINQKIALDWAHEFQLHVENSSFSRAELSLYAAIREGNVITEDNLTVLRPVLPENAKLLAKKVPYIFQVLRDYPNQATYDLLYDFILSFYKEAKIKGKAYLSLVILCHQHEELERLLPLQAQPGERQYDYCNARHLETAIIFGNLAAVKALVNTLGRVLPPHLEALQQCRSNTVNEIAEFLLLDNELIVSALNNTMQALEGAGMVQGARVFRDNFHLHLLAQYLPENLDLSSLGHDLSCPIEVGGRKYSLIHTAARYGHVELLSYFVENQRVPFNLQTGSLPLSFQTKAKHTPLIIACVHNQVDIIKYLLGCMLGKAQDKFEPMKSELVQALNYAIQAKAYDAVKLLVNYCKMQTPRDAETNSRLSWLVHYANDDKAFKMDNMPLSLAIQAQECGIVKLLLSLKKISSLVNYPDQNGNTALHLAVMHKAPEVIRLLLASGANATLTNGKGKTPFDLANKATKALFNNINQLELLADAPVKKQKRSTSSFFANNNPSSSSHVASSSGTTPPAR